MLKHFGTSSPACLPSCKQNSVFLSVLFGLFKLALLLLAQVRLKLSGFLIVVQYSPFCYFKILVCIFRSEIEKQFRLSSCKAITKVV